MANIYAQLNSHGYCIALSTLSGTVTAPDLVQVDTYDEALYLNRKYDDGWTEEYFTPPIPEVPEPDPSAITLDAALVALAELGAQQEQDRISTQLALAEIDSQREQDKIANQLAIAELAETLLTGGANNG